MSLYDYKESQEIASKDYSFCSLIMAAIRKADSRNYALLNQAFPDIVLELVQRYNAPGGLLPSEELAVTDPGYVDHSAGWKRGMVENYDGLD